ncbi:hypothetical protein IW262DRAFT_129434 [Armillaria fumosa]|nr:hypothetical protein IW262DRAFT_129434 [Armillaria fumosa]
MTTCRIKNDIILGKPWSPPKCHIDGHAQNLLGGTYFYEDADRREALRQAQEPLSTTTQLEERKASSVIPPLPEPQSDARSDYDASIKEPEGEDSIAAFDAQSKYSESPSADGEGRESRQSSHKRPFFLKTLLRGLFRKLLPCVPCRRGNSCGDDGSSVFSESFDPYAVIGNLFGPPPEDTMPVIVVSKNLQAVQEINNPWDFFAN